MIYAIVVPPSVPIPQRRAALLSWLQLVLSDLQLSRCAAVAAFLDLEAAVRAGGPATLGTTQCFTAEHSAKELISKNPNTLHASELSFYLLLSSSLCSGTSAGEWGHICCSACAQSGAQFGVSARGGLCREWWAAARCADEWAAGGSPLQRGGCWGWPVGGGGRQRGQWRPVRRQVQPCMAQCYEETPQFMLSRSLPLHLCCAGAFRMGCSLTQGTRCSCCQPCLSQSCSRGRQREEKS